MKAEISTNILKMFAYGNPIRNAIEKIIRSGKGALIVFADKSNFKKILKIAHGGFKIDKKLTEELLTELAKLDGAIIVNENKISYANVLLTPNSRIHSEETGTRHQAAERTARQFNAIVLAVSERTKIATVYFGDRKLRLNPLNELLIKARESFTILDRHREFFEKLIKHLNTAEILEVVSIADISEIFQRKKIIDHISKITSSYLAELGSEGKIIEFQFEEIKKFINSEIESIKKDYEDQINFESIEEALEKMDYSQIISKHEVIKIFEANKKTDVLMPKGYRLLKNIPLINDEEIKEIIAHFRNLKNLILSDEKELIKVRGVGEKKAKKIKEYFSNL